VFHGAVNTLGVVNTAADASTRGYGNAISYGLIALLIGSAAWNRDVIRNSGVNLATSAPDKRA
jgi:hypothetical protein